MPQVLLRDLDRHARGDRVTGMRMPQPVRARLIEALRPLTSPRWRSTCAHSPKNPLSRPSHKVRKTQLYFPLRLFSRGIRIFDYPRFAESLRDRIRQRAQEVSEANGVHIEHVNKRHVPKEDLIAGVLAIRGDAPAACARDFGRADRTRLCCSKTAGFDPRSNPYAYFAAPCSVPNHTSSVPGLASRCGLANKVMLFVILLTISASCWALARSSSW